MSNFENPAKKAAGEKAPNSKEMKVKKSKVDDGSEALSEAYNEKMKAEQSPAKNTNDLAADLKNYNRTEAQAKDLLDQLDDLKTVEGVDANTLTEKKKLLKEKIKDSGADDYEELQNAVAEVTQYIEVQKVDAENQKPEKADPSLIQKILKEGTETARVLTEEEEKALKTAYHASLDDLFAAQDEFEVVKSQYDAKGIFGKIRGFFSKEKRDAKKAIKEAEQNSDVYRKIFNDRHPEGMVLKKGMGGVLNRNQASQNQMKKDTNYTPKI